MDPLHATLEEFAADGYTHVSHHYPRCRMTLLRKTSFNRRAWEAARTAWMTMKLLPLASVLTITGNLALAADDNPSIEELVKTGWQIAGYSQAFDNRPTFILFRNPDPPYLVQCRVGFDVTRNPSTYSLCYKLR
jgi:hypothetical protein